MIGRVDWKHERDRVNLAALVASYLGPAPGRAGERGRRLWWCCPLHSDGNPSFCVDPGKPYWKCYGCGESGDAAKLVMKLDGLTFPEAVSKLTGGDTSGPREWPRPVPAPRPEPAPEPESQGLTEAGALALVDEAQERLWSREGAAALEHLVDERCLLPETVRAFRLGWTPGVELTTKDGRSYRARGIVIPWFDRGRPVLVKLRQPEGSKPKYAEAFRGRPRVFPDPRAVRAGQDLIIVEGEFDVMVLAQVMRFTSVVTLGSASARPEGRTLGALTAADQWYIATDGDEAGDKAAAGWPEHAIRIRPPEGFKDWTELAQAGIDLGCWWQDRIGGGEPPPVQLPPELPPVDEAPTIDPIAWWRWEVADWPADRWNAWLRRADELAPPGADAATIIDAQYRAYLELGGSDDPTAADGMARKLEALDSIRPQPGQPDRGDAWEGDLEDLPTLRYTDDQPGHQ